MNEQGKTAEGWRARIGLRFSPVGDRTAMWAEHCGPLCVQQPFYPEGAPCHVYLIHPPGGVVGGDGLEIDAAAEAGAAALVTTPGAAKFYRSAGPAARQTVRLAVASGASLEWLPQETIVYPGADAASRLRVDLARDARFFGWEVTTFGLPETGWPYDRGSFEQHVAIFREGEPLFFERCRYAGGDPLMTRGWGLDGRIAVGALFVTAQDPAALATAREAAKGRCAPGETFCATQVDGLVVCRAAAAEARRARGLLARVWTALRPGVLGRPACPPRIWST